MSETEKPPFRPIICIDFDGVLHSYTSGWKGVGVIPDAPVPGAIEWLTSIIPEAADVDMPGEVQPCIYSSRSREPRGIAAMKTWLMDNGFPKQHIQDGALGFPLQKPSAFLTIDDRAMCFDGHFPTIETMRDFKPWYKKESVLETFPPSLKATLAEFLGELKCVQPSPHATLLAALGNRLYCDLHQLEDNLASISETI